MKLSPLLIGFSISWIGCSDSASRRAGRDALAWPRDPTPAITVSSDAEDGRLQLELPVDGALLTSGGLVIADAGALSLLFFDETGNSTLSAGQEGSGPGEVRSVSWLGRCGTDSIAVWDRMQGRLLFFDEQGGFLDQHTLPMGNEGETAPAFLTCSRNGAFAAVGQPTTLASTERFVVFEGPVMAGRTSEDLHALDISTAVTEWAAEFRQARPLGATSYIAATSDGFWLAQTDSASVSAFDLTGELRTTFRVATPPRQPTPVHVQAAARLLASGVSRADLAQRIQERAVRIPVPEVLPPFGGLFIDPLGTIWLQTTLPGDSATALEGYTQDGTLVGRLLVPRTLQIFEIDVDRILGSYEDELGNVLVVVYRFNRNAA